MENNFYNRDEFKIIFTIKMDWKLFLLKNALKMIFTIK